MILCNPLFVGIAGMWIFKYGILIFSIKKVRKIGKTRLIIFMIRLLENHFLNAFLRKCLLKKCWAAHTHRKNNRLKTNWPDIFTALQVANEQAECCIRKECKTKINNYLDENRGGIHGNVYGLLPNITISVGKAIIRAIIFGLL